MPFLPESQQVHWCSGSAYTFPVQQALFQGIDMLFLIIYPSDDVHISYNYTTLFDGS